MIVWLQLNARRAAWVLFWLTVCEAYSNYFLFDYLFRSLFVFFLTICNISFNSDMTNDDSLKIQNSILPGLILNHLFTCRRSKLKNKNKNRCILLATLFINSWQVVFRQKRLIAYILFYLFKFEIIKTIITWKNWDVK